MKHPLGCAVAVSHHQTIGHLSMEQSLRWQHFYYVLKMSVNRVSITFGLASWKIHVLWATLPQNRAIGRLSRQKLLQQHRYYVPKMSVNGVSTTFSHVSWKILELCGDMKL
jgi:hypothetical protein